MPGYILISQNEFSPPKQRGMAPFVEEIGLLDFLRELRHEDLPFSRNACIRVEGLEEVLFAARPDCRDLALRIRNRLNASANELHKQLLTVQIVFKGKLERGANLRDHYRGEDLPIHLIFGTPTSSDADGSYLYKVPFSLTTP
jgi:hypothetical protein